MTNDGVPVMPLQIDMLNDAREPVTAYFRAGLDTVEITVAGGGPVRVIDRDMFRIWLGRPRGLFMIDDVEFRGVPAGVSMSFDTVQNWVLSEFDVHQLRQMIDEGGPVRDRRPARSWPHPRQRA